MQFGPICKLATTPGKTSEMLNILKHMGVTAYGPRQRGNLQILCLFFLRSPRRRNGGQTTHLLKRRPPTSPGEQCGEARRFHHRTSTSSFSQCFRQLVDGLSLNNLLPKPHSLKQGNATPFPSHKFIGWCCAQRPLGKPTYCTEQDIAAHSIISKAKGKMR